MNLIDLTPEQLKRAASIKEQIEGLNKTAARHPRCTGYTASCAVEKSDHERFCEKADCGYSECEMGKDSSLKTGDRFC